MGVSAGRVIVAGSINMDIVAQVERHPVPGETLAGSSLAYFPGGKGANQAVAAARAGAAVAMIGAVGDDAFASDLFDFLKSNGIDIAAIGRKAATPTGTALITVDQRGENSIVVVAGANGAIRADEVVSALTCRPGDVLLAQFETPLEATAAFFAAGRSAGATCILNPAPAAVVPAEIIAHTHIFVVNETELGVITGSPLSHTPTATEISAAHDVLRTMGFTGCLVATLGTRGAIAVLGNRIVEIDGRRVEAVDTTGAGDCFVGYLASSLALGRDLDQALRTANIAASLCVQRPGAGPSMPHMAEVDAQ